MVAQYAEGARDFPSNIMTQSSFHSRTFPFSILQRELRGRGRECGCGSGCGCRGETWADCCDRGVKVQRAFKVVKAVKAARPDFKHPLARHPVVRHRHPVAVSNGKWRDPSHKLGDSAAWPLCPFAILPLCDSDDSRVTCPCLTRKREKGKRGKSPKTRWIG